MMLSPSLELVVLENPSEADFLRGSAQGTRPVLIRGAMSDWPALSKWNIDYFRRTWGHLLVEVRRTLDKSEARTLSVAEFMDYVSATEDPDPYYLRNWQFHLKQPEFLNDYRVLPFFKSWAEAAPPAQNPHFSWVFIGPKNSFSGLHIDVMNTSAWNAVTVGSKRWFFYPEEQEEYLYNGEVNVFDPDLAEYPKFFNAEPLVCEQRAGDIVYTPSNWWHAVKNLEPCVSITENFVNNLNFEQVQQFLVYNHMHDELALMQQLRAAYASGAAESASS
ncbi:MAG: cupin-like domain-containing protein [Janthinobacterium lividum]